MDDATPQEVVVPIAVAMPAGAALIVEIASPSYGSGYFVLGGTTSPQSVPGYFSCDFDTPTNHNAAYLIEVTGTVP